MTAAPVRPATFLPEDLALAGWNLVAIPVGFAVGGGWMSGEGAPLLGLIEVAAIAGAIVALATRTPDASPVDADSFRGWALAGPLIGAVFLVGDDASDRLGLDVGGLLGAVAALTVVAAFIAANRLPVLRAEWRRLLVAPFVFIAAGFFTDFVASVFDGLDLGELAGQAFGGGSSVAVGAPETASIAGLVLLFLVAGSAAFYAMLVVAPRELAAPERRPVVWGLRFLLFLGSAVAGAGGWLFL